MPGVETDGHRMIATTCAICGDAAEETEFYGETLGHDAATFDRFSARRSPDRRSRQRHTLTTATPRICRPSCCAR